MSKRIYDTRTWRKFRAYILARDNFLCQRCLKKNILTAGDTVHHWKPVEDYPELAYDPDNCITWCAPCHSSYERKSEKRKKAEMMMTKRKARIIKG